MRALVLYLGLAGCGSLVMETAKELEKMSPMDAEPSQMAIAIDLPDGFGIYPDSARIKFSAERKDLQEKRYEEFILHRTGESRAIFQVAGRDRARLIEMQELARRWERENPKESVGAFTVDLMPCTNGGFADLTETFSIAIRLETDAPFKPLLRNAPVSAIVSRSEFKDLPSCPIQSPTPLVR